MLAWFSGNISPNHKRSVAIPVAASIPNIPNVLSGQIHLATNAPRHIFGNAVSLGLEFVVLKGRMPRMRGRYLRVKSKEAMNGWNIRKSIICVDSITMSNDTAVVEGDAVDVIGRYC